MFIIEELKNMRLEFNFYDIAEEIFILKERIYYPYFDFFYDIERWMFVL